MLRNFKLLDGDPNKLRFNKQMNGGRIVIENDFVLFKGRWLILKSTRCSMKKLVKLCICVVFCIVLQQPMGKAPQGSRPKVNVNVRLIR